MLIQFSVENFRSIRNEQTLSMVKNAGDDLGASNWFSVKSEVDLDLLNSCAIYGANAAGKSNLIHALKAMEFIVVNSAKESQSGERLDVTPFLFCTKNSKKPTKFEVIIVVENVQYDYGFSVDDTRVHSEWLIAYPKGRPQTWFKRTFKKQKKEYDWNIGANFTGKKQHIIEATRSNALFLSTADQLNNKQLKPIFNWFKTTIRIAKIGGWSPSYSASECFKNDKRKNNILKFLKAADLGISDIKVIKEKFDESILPDEMPATVRNSIIKDLKDTDILDIKTAHRNDEGENIFIDFEEESNGTQKIFSYAGPWLDALQKGYVLVIDELHDNLHPKIVEFLVRMFHNKKTNPNNAQLIFTTHETSILNQDIFRRDQVWFCEKDEFQATELFPLTDFRPRKNRDNLEFSYLGGRYGALPFIDSFEDIDELVGEVIAG